ncbi:MULTISPECIES: hypothetical protein [Bacillus]|uniref:Uncharacterized protein n=1 Tax=Bacillus thuringiensis subsp. jegathesan TaxID=56955 RepID=A0A9X6M1L7_BACTJ|nr:MULTISPECIES: hypothetical protein [Bacillus]MEC5308415.1 hypothetical protein [Bacillus thuringiensis]OUB64474.1 hypothetical protein BK750_17685 [Bacillus thuringiensis serovar jegathesan]CCW05255.1 hypothetical protein EBGED10_19770 [Bacillus sp. GeD10]
MKIRTYTLSYTIVAPSGEMYPTQKMIMYTESQEYAIALLDKEIQRRLGTGYHRHISCTNQEEEQEPIQLSLF